MTHRRAGMAAYLLAFILACDQLSKWWLKVSKKANRVYNFHSWAGVRICA
jgi:hypothetical protein